MKKLTILLCVCLYACGSGDGGDKTLAHFKGVPTDSLHVARYIDLEEYDILKPTAITKTNNKYYIWNWVPDSMIVCFNPQNNTVVRGVSEGQGPGDVVPGIAFFSWKDMVLLLEVNRQKIHRINNNDQILYLSDYKSLPMENGPDILNMQLLPNGYITQGIQDKGWIASYDNEDRLVSTISYPKYDVLNDVQTTREIDYLY
jgi:hypothetical protein